MELHQLVNYSSQRIYMVTFILCATTARIAKISNEEIISPVVVKLSSGPSKRTRQSMKKVVIATLGLDIEDILQGTMVVGKELAKVIKELV